MAAAPADLRLRWTGVERDPTSARIAQARFPGAQIIASPLEHVPLPAGVFDLAIGNVPFADVQIYDKDAPKLNLHNYCLWRSLQAVHPGGYVIALTSRYTMDAASSGQRAELAALGDLVGAIRLPSGALGEAGTRAVADIVVLRRRGEHEPRRGADWLERGAVLRRGQRLRRRDVRQRILRRAPSAHPGDAGDRPRSVPSRAGGPAIRGPRGGSRPQHRRGGERSPRAGARGTRAAAARTLDDVVLADRDGRKEGSFHLIGSGVKQVRGGRLESVDGPARELRALIGLRDAVIAMLDAESDLDASDAVLAPLRSRLNARYDAYVAKYGPLNRATVVEGKPDPETGMATLSRRRPRMGGFRQDPDYVTVLALELYDDTTQKAEKAPIFDRRVIRRAVHPEHADSPAEALAFCLNEHGHLDVATVARLLGVTEQEAPGLLGDLAYCDPETNQWTTAPEYLSGDVRAKLQIAQAAADRDPARWRRNVDALTAVVPRDLAPHEIRVRLGAPWIPAADVARFCDELLEATPVITHETLTASWTVKASAWQMNSPAATIEWGTGRVNAFRIVELALNGSTPVVYDTVTLPDGNTTRVKNVAETIAAVEKRQALDARFAEWLWEDPERTDRLIELYNRRYNAIVPRRFDGSHLTFDGLADGWSPYPWQRDIVWRNVSSPSALCGHDVGSGKTLSMVATAMTLRRLGLATKPMIITPGHLLEQVARDAKRLYPGAKVLMVTKEDLTPERRKLFAARCATGDWDLVVMTHSGFGLLPVSPANRGRVSRRPDRRVPAGARQRGRALDHRQEPQQGARPDAPAAGGVTRQAARRRRELRATRCRLPHGRRGAPVQVAARPQPHDRLLAPGVETGNRPGAQAQVDPRAQRRRALGRVLHGHAGEQHPRRALHPPAVPQPGPSRRARPDQLRCVGRAVRRLGDAGRGRAGRRVVPHAHPAGPVHEHTGAAPPVLRVRRRAPQGGVHHRRPQARGVDRHRRSHRGPAVVCRPARPPCRRASVRRAGAARPEPAEPRGQHALGVRRRPQGRARPRARRATRPGGRPRSRRWPAKSSTGGCRRSTTPTGPTSRSSSATSARPKEKGGSRASTARSAARCIEAGMPPSMIRFVHSAKTDAARAQLFADCRSGKVAVLIGSTPKLGTGVNVQERCIAIHHLDPPWKPAEVEQRDGRGPRPGNRHDVVDSLRYVTPGTFDAYSWETLLRKFIFVSQLLVGEGDAREVEDLGDGVLTYAEVKAAATGDPLILELTAVQSEISRLRGLATSHTRTQRRAEQDADADRNEASAAAHRAEVLTAIADTAERSAPGWVSPRGERVAETARITEQMADLISAALTTGMRACPAWGRGPAFPWPPRYPSQARTGRRSSLCRSERHRECPA